MTSFDRHIVAPHDPSCLAYDGLCVHEPRMIEMLAMAEEANLDASVATAELIMPRGQWLLLTREVDVAAHNVATRDVAEEPMLNLECSCPSCDDYATHITGRLIDLMRLNLVLADVSWGRGVELTAAYAEFWPQLSEALGE